MHFASETTKKVIYLSAELVNNILRLSPDYEKIMSDKGIIRHWCKEKINGVIRQFFYH